MFHIEAVTGNNIGIITSTQGLAQDAQVPHTGVIAINPTMTHHINPTADHPQTEAHHHTTPETKVTHIHIHPTNPQDKIHIHHTLQQITKQTTSQEEHQSENRRSTHGSLQF